MERIAERILELLKTDPELRDAVLEVLHQKAEADKALAAYRARK